MMIGTWNYCWGCRRKCGTTVEDAEESVELLLRMQKKVWNYCWGCRRKCGTTVEDAEESDRCLCSYRPKLPSFNWKN
jgi:hypothetical protein